MSSKWTGKVWDLKIDVPSRMILLAMADHADHNGEHIYAPAPFLAWKTGYKDRNVWNILRNLQVKGLIVVTDGDRGVPNEYKFDFSDAPIKDPYTGMKPKTPDRSPAKIAGDRRAKIAGDNPETPAKIAGVDQTPAKIAAPTPAKIAIDSNKYHIESDLTPPPPTNPQSAGGGGFDPKVVRLFTSYDIKQAEPLARLYRDAFPDVTLDQLRDLCQRLYEPDAGKHAGGRLYRLLKCGPPLVSPPAAPAAPERPPAPILRPGVPVAQLRAWRDRYEKEHSA